MLICFLINFFNLIKNSISYLALVIEENVSKREQERSKQKMKFIYKTR